MNYRGLRSPHSFPAAPPSRRIPKSNRRPSRSTRSSQRVRHAGWARKTTQPQQINKRLAPEFVSHHERMVSGSWGRRHRGSRQGTGRETGGSWAGLCMGAFSEGAFGNGEKFKTHWKRCQRASRAKKLEGDKPSRFPSLARQPRGPPLAV